jgi:hypothetical protein
MNLKNDRELQSTREKLRLLQEHYQSRLREKAENPHTRELSLRSLNKMINQLTEEITLYEIHAGASTQK